MINLFKKLFNLIKSVAQKIFYTSLFVILLFSYVLNNFLSSLYISSKVPKFIKTLLIKPIKTFLDYFTAKLDNKEPESISTLDLIDLSVKNLRKKKARTFITIGGMSLGISAIVFLVSIGYGLQSLVNSRVARLEELRQAEVSVQPGSPLKMSQKSVDTIKELPEVREAAPLISVVAKINFNNSVTDSAAYGVVSTYFDDSAIKPVEGGFFTAKKSSVNTSNEVLGNVAGVSVENIDRKFGDAIQPINFNIEPDTWVRVRDGPSTNANILGYTKRPEGTSNGILYWGSPYDGPDGRISVAQDKLTLGKWVKSKVYLWEQKGSTFEPAMDNTTNTPSQVEGYFSTINVQINYVSGGNVLAESTSSADAEKKLTITSTDTPGFVKILEESQEYIETATTKVPLGQDAIREAVINTALMEVLGISKTKALGSKYNVSYIITGDLLENDQQKLESETAEYTIVGVIEDQSIPLMYVSIDDLKSLGIGNFSQIRVTTENQKALATIRSQIEAMGFSTSSVADTVKQIDSLFTTVRFFLATIGFIALFVASLGMFNTLTVSLLERTREVGLLKAMGMRSSEIEKLFLAESVMMGVFGGLLGIIAGFLFGKLLGVLLTVFSLVKGSGVVDVTSLPISFVVLIIALSTGVGLLTGVLPARRAKKISALNALRYE